MNRIVTLILALTVGCPTWAADLRFDARERSRLSILRQSNTYKRVFNICSTAYDLSKSVYAKAAAKEAAQMLLMNVETWEDKLVQNYTVSELLENDLTHEGFHLAMQDCGYNEGREKLFVINLLALDVFGKLGGVGLSAWVFTKVIYKLSRFFFARFPKTLLGVSLASVAIVSKEHWDKYESPANDQSTTNKRPVEKIEAVDFIENKLDVSQKTRLQLIELKIATINYELQKHSPDSPTYAMLEEQKATLLKLSSL